MFEVSFSQASRKVEFYFPGGSDGKSSVYNVGDRVQSLGGEDLLEKEMAIHSRFLAWRIPWTEEPDRLQSMGLQRVWHNWATSFSLSLKVEYFLLFGFCPPKVGPVVPWTSYRVWFVLSFCLFVCLFFLWWARLSEVVILSAMIRFIFLFCLLFRWGILDGVLLVVGWCWVLYSNGFLGVSSHKPYSLGLVLW